MGVVNVQISWADVTQPEVGGYAVYYDTVNHSTDSAIVANASLLRVGKSTTAVIGALNPNTTYYFWVRWESSFGNSNFSPVKSFTTGGEISPPVNSALNTLDADLTVNEAAVAAITTGTGSNAVVDETKLTNIKKPNVSGNPIPGLQSWPMGRVADTTALEAIPIASCNANPGLTVYVEDRARMYHWNTNATSGYAEPSDKTNPGVDSGWWVYAVDEDPEHYLIPVVDVAALRAISYYDLKDNARVYVESLDADMFFKGIGQAVYSPNDNPNTFGGWYFNRPVVPVNTNLAALQQGTNRGELVWATNKANPALLVWDGSDWKNAGTGAIEKSYP